VHVEALDEPRTVAQRAAPLLAADPAGTTVLASVLAREIDLPGDEPCWWYLVVDADEPVGLAMHDGAWPPYLGPMPVEGAEALAEALDARSAVLPGMNGETEAVAAAVTRWQRLHPDVSVVDTRGTRLYRLHDLEPPTKDGAPRLAEPSDRDLVLDWSLAFSADARTPTRGVARAIEHRLHRRGGGYVLWCLDGEPVSLAGMGRPSYGVARIGPVYTPPAWRRRGFGAAVTAAASSRLLQTGARDVVLFTDLGNPTSNKIYQQIGFRPVRDFVEVRLA
jgi:RimJ/RimL family protein N-acetyltransferase